MGFMQVATFFATQMLPILIAHDLLLVATLRSQIAIFFALHDFEKDRSDISGDEGLGGMAVGIMVVGGWWQWWSVAMVIEACKTNWVVEVEEVKFGLG
ncbi:hypothetical protein RIF29_29953 [Crotalaria pallida]|uniref:Uncharacterized protein n=1 Tax=Crotalaria pallida TaxID=3830 RepID=A0AAN9EFF5_CROPI